MGLIAKTARNATPQRSTGRCRVCVLLDKLDDEDAAELRELLAQSVHDWNHKRIVTEVLQSPEVQAKYPDLPTVNPDNLGFHRNSRH